MSRFMTADDVTIAITKTPVVKVNPITKTRTSKYYAWQTVDGEWVRAEHERVAQWEARGILYVLVAHTWESYRNPVNTHGDKDIVTHDILGAHAARVAYCQKVAPTAHVMSDTDTSTIILWSF